MAVGLNRKIPVLLKKLCIIKLFPDSWKAPSSDSTSGRSYSSTDTDLYVSSHEERPLHLGVVRDETYGVGTPEFLFAS